MIYIEAQRSVYGLVSLEHNSHFLVPLVVNRRWRLASQDLIQPRLHVDVRWIVCPRILSSIDSVDEVDDEEDRNPIKTVSSIVFHTAPEIHVSYPMYAVRKLLADQFEGQNTSKPLMRVRKTNPTIATYEPHGWNHLLWYGS